jgi:hypothetical protein
VVAYRDINRKDRALVRRALDGVVARSLCASMPAVCVGRVTDIGGVEHQALARKYPDHLGLQELLLCATRRRKLDSNLGWRNLAGTADEKRQSKKYQ